MRAEPSAIAALERTVELLEAYGSAAARGSIDFAEDVVSRLEDAGLDLGDAGGLSLERAQLIEALRGFGCRRERHFSAPELARLLNGRELAVETQVRAVAHFAGGCGSCWSRLRGLELDDPRPTADPVLQALRTVVVPEPARLSPGALWALGQVHQRPLAFCRLILEHGLLQARERADRALEAVLEAVLPAGSALVFTSAEERPDLFALLHGFLAEGTRLASLPDRALSHLVQALSYLPHGSRGEIEAWLLEMRSRLALSGGDFRRAAVFTEAALAHLHAPELGARRAEALGELGFLLILCGDLARARERLRQAHSLVSKLKAGACAWLRLSILHSFAHLEVELAFDRQEVGCSGEHLLRAVEILLDEHRELYDTGSDEIRAQRAHLSDRIAWAHQLESVHGSPTSGRGRESGHGPS